MLSLPDSTAALLVRTDFADEPSWQLACEEAAAVSAEGFQAHFLPVSDRSFDGASWKAVKIAVPSNHRGSVIVLIADSTTLSALWGVENNLNIANMTWEDFAGSADEKRVFRGF